MWRFSQADNLTKEQRAYSCGGQGTRTAQKERSARQPEFRFPRFHTMVFVDVCYWHGCEYWLPRIQGNAQRDRRNTRELRAAGWKVIRIREHELKASPVRCCIWKIMTAMRPEEAC
jgi:G:T-mismatch repair DNA endonuclease (very short patch repair protein)